MPVAAQGGVPVAAKEPVAVEAVHVAPGVPAFPAAVQCISAGVGDIFSFLSLSSERVSPPSSLSLIRPVGSSALLVVSFLQLAMLRCPLLSAMVAAVENVENLLHARH